MLYPTIVTMAKLASLMELLVESVCVSITCGSLCAVKDGV